MAADAPSLFSSVSFSPWGGADVQTSLTVSGPGVFAHFCYIVISVENFGWFHRCSLIQLFPQHKLACVKPAGSLARLLAQIFVFVSAGTSVC